MTGGTEIGEVFGVCKKFLTFFGKGVRRLSLVAWLTAKALIHKTKIKNRKKLLNVSILCEQKDDDDWDEHGVLVT